MRLLFIALTLASLIAAGFGTPTILLHGADNARPQAMADASSNVANSASNSASGPSHPTVSKQSAIEDATGIHYQHDGGIDGDAPDTCAELDDRRVLDAFGNGTEGLLVQEDDESDVYYSPIPANLTGQRMVFQLAASVGFEMYDLSFDILSADCSFSVFDPDAEIYHPDHDVPAEPFEAKTAHQTYEYTAAGNHTCDESEWKFQIKQKRGASPSSLYVEWTNGDYAYIANDDTDPSQVAKYLTAHNVDHTIARVAVQMPVGFDGGLNVSHGPCTLTDGQADIPAPTSGATSGEFTVVESGDYVLRVWISRDAAEHAQDRIDEARAMDLQGALNGQKECHTRYCQPAFAMMGYHASLLPKSAGNE